MSEKQGNFTLVTTPQDVSPNEIAKVYNSVGFTIPDASYTQPDFKARMFAPGVFGFFVFKELDLIGVGRLLLHNIVERFAHTSIYADAFKGSENVFGKFGIRPQSKLVSCSRAFTKNAAEI